MRLILVRHGATRALAEGRFQGWLDEPLTEEGERQAERLGEALAGTRTDLVLGSDLRRAWRTAEILAPHLAATPVAEPRLRECRFGEWEGLTREEAALRFPEEFARWRENGDPVPGGEAPEAVLERALSVCDEAYRLHAEGAVLAVTHSLVIRVLLGAVLGLAPRESRGRLALSPAGASEVEYRGRDGSRIVRANWAPEWER